MACVRHADTVGFLHKAVPEIAIMMGVLALPALFDTLLKSKVHL
uniref:Uncharacterized protein n=1 Tax=Anguilla anguilla TaxID=7936 RepID=A0A0E9PJJ8_ANGAN